VEGLSILRLPLPPAAHRLAKEPTVSPPHGVMDEENAECTQRDPHDEVCHGQQSTSWTCERWRERTDDPGSYSTLRRSRRDNTEVGGSSLPRPSATESKLGNLEDWESVSEPLEVTAVSRIRG